MITVDRSYFPNRPWHTSSSCFVVVDWTTIRTGDFIMPTNPDYRSACAAEMCRYLGALQIMGTLFDDKNNATQINLHIASDYLGVIRKL